MFICPMLLFPPSVSELVATVALDFLVLGKNQHSW